MAAPNNTKLSTPAAPETADAGNRMYTLRDPAERVIAILNAFLKLEGRMKSRRRVLYVVFFCAVVIFVMVWGSLQNYQGGIYSGAPAALTFAGVLFIIFGYPIRALLQSRKSSYGFPAPGSAVYTVWIICGFMFFPMVLGISETGGSLQIVKALQGGGAGDGITGKIIAVTYSTVFVALALWLLSLRRHRRCTPQGFELHFCGTILDELLREMHPQTPVRVSFNPFPNEWSAVSRKASVHSKTADYDILLDARFPFTETTFASITVIHRRTSKGRRKHKGYKHKVKIKYQLPLGKDQALNKNGMAQALFAEFTAADDAFAKLKDTRKFQGKLPSSNVSIEKRGDKLVASQTLITPCVFRKDLAAADLPHPLYVLHAFRGLSLGLDKFLKHSS